MLLKPHGEAPPPTVRPRKGRDEYVYYGLTLRSVGRRRSYPP